MSIYADAKSSAANRASMRGRQLVEKAGFTEQLASGSSTRFDQLSSTTRSANAYAFYRGWVYTVIHAVARRVAMQSWGVGVKSGVPQKQEAERHRLSTTKAKLLQKWNCVKAVEGTSIEVLDEHPLLDLLARPNDVQRKFDFLYMSAVNLLLTGESYWVCSTSDEGIDELWAIPTHWITPKHDGGLFTSYSMQLDYATTITLPPELVARTYMPSPADPRTAMSPLQAVISSVKVDDSIVESQKQLFDRGIFPNLIVTVGRRIGPDGKLTDVRPSLSMAQRQQLIRAIRQIWSQSVNAGDPAIVDGFIESIHKLHSNPQEMDWLTSGEMVRKRIMMAFGVNEISVGLVQNSNRAAAVVAEQSICANSVNPLISALSETADEFLSPKYSSEPERLLVWLEPSEPADPERELERWKTARQQGDVTRTEFRSEVLGLPPLLEDEVDKAYRNPLLDSPAGLQAAVWLMSAVGQGQIPTESASALLQLFYQIDKDRADAVAGVGQQFVPEPAPPEQDKPPEGVPEERPISQLNARLDALKSAGLDRDQIKAIKADQTARVQREVARVAAEHFSRIVKQVAQQVRQSDVVPNQEQAAQQTERIMKGFDLQDWTDDLKKTIEPSLTWATLNGAMAELAFMAARGSRVQRPRDGT